MHVLRRTCCIQAAFNKPHKGVEQMECVNDAGSRPSLFFWQNLLLDTAGFRAMFRPVPTKTAKFEANAMNALWVLEDSDCRPYALVDIHYGRHGEARKNETLAELRFRLDSSSSNLQE